MRQGPRVSIDREGTVFLRTLSISSSLRCGSALLVLAAAMPLLAADDKPLSRAQALKAIEQPTAAVRRTAVARLAEVGTMADADRLVAHLGDDDRQVRQLSEAALWRIWSRSGDRAIDALQLHGVEQMEAGQLAEAVKTFSEIIRRKPAFAEGWNKRATVLFLMGQYEASLKDCDEVLKRNQNHFGALSGYGQIYISLGDFEMAIEYLERALKVNPNLPGAAATIQLLERQVDEKRRKTI
jgi:tetratricopeptide (TPR) repeat protein